MSARMPEFVTREYKIFERERRELRRKGIYERACEISHRIFFRFKAPKFLKDFFASPLLFSELNITPAGVTSFTVLYLGFTFSLSLILRHLGVPRLVYILSFVASFFGTYLIASYPFIKAFSNKIKASNQAILAVLYMVSYMRYSPNLEGAVRAVIEGLEGPLPRDFKKLLWDLEMGRYTTIYEGLEDYFPKWTQASPEFVDAIRTLHASLSEPNEQRRIEMIERAFSSTLEGILMRIRKFSQALRLPIMLLHSFGVLLPIIGLTLFPIVSLLMAESVDPLFIFIGYDVVLPLLVYHLMNSALRKRPSTILLPDVSGHPEVPPRGKFFLTETTKLPVLPIAGLFILLIIPGIWNYQTLFQKTPPLKGLFNSMFFIWAPALSLGVYYLLNTKDSTKIREQVKEVEREYSDAIYQLGNRLAGGAPLENAISKSMGVLSGSRMVDFFYLILRNIRLFGMTLEEAIFNPSLGAINYYPHKLIKNTLKTIVDAAKRGTEAAAYVMISISDYIKRLHRVELQLKEILGEVTSSMRFQIYLLTPIVAGVVVGLESMMASALAMMFERFGEFGQGIPGVPGVASAASLSIINLSEMIPSGIFQLIVGLYFLEMTILSSIFLSRLEFGIDRIARERLTGKALLISTLIYTVVLLLMSIIFGGLLRGMVALV